jgi:hypothetical protein
MFDRLFASVDRWTLRIEGSRRTLLMFAGLSAFLVVELWPTAWIGNEENYFQLGYRTFAPEQFSRFSAVFDASRARFVPLYLMGYVVHLLGYETAHAVARILMAILYAAGLTYLLSALRLSVWDALLIMVVFLLAGEDLIGAEWLFRDLEPKTLAYALIFFAFGFAVRGRWTAATIAGATATYMHFLVGGFWTVLILVQQWLETKRRREWLRSLALYGMLTLPLGLVLVQDQLRRAALPVVGLADEIYANRNLWHVAPFASRWVFWEWLPGFVATFVLFLALGAIRARYPDAGRPIALVSRSAFLGLTYLLVALAVAFVDRHTQLLGKFFLFRPSALTLLLALTAISALLHEHLPADVTALKSLVMFALVVSFSWRTFEMQVDRSLASSAIPERAELIAAIVSHTAPGDIVLIQPIQGEGDPDYLSLHRQIPRPTLVSHKFVPTNPVDIVRWQSYLEMRHDVFAKGCVAPMPVPVRWLVTLRPKSVARLVNCGPPVWRKGNVALIPVPH